MHSVTVTKEIDVDIDLEDVETEDLMEELSRRTVSAGIRLGMVIEMLQRERAPTALIETLREWDRVPVADEPRLAAWKKWAVG